MTWNLFIDDERMPPDDGRDWVIAVTMAQAMVEILDRGMPSYISFDHDLGLGVDPNLMPEVGKTGYDIAKAIVEMDMNATDEKYKLPADFSFYVHSQNPIGTANIEAYLNTYLAQKG